MRDELEKLIVNAALNGAYEDAGQRVLSTDVISATLTSIINLVDKEKLQLKANDVYISQLMQENDEMRQAIRTLIKYGTVEIERVISSRTTITVDGNRLGELSEQHLFELHRALNAYMQADPPTEVKL